MKRTEAQVLSNNHIGQVFIDQSDQNKKLFYISIEKGFLGRVIELTNHKQHQWYSPDITDKELVSQIGEWIQYNYSIPS